MQPFDLVFFLVVLLFILRLVVPSLQRLLSPGRFILCGLVALSLMIVIHGVKWQVFPAVLAFVLLNLGALKKSQANIYSRCLAAIPLTILLVASISLSLLLPVFNLPEPQGPFGVGTFGFNLTDSERVERFNPAANRELSIRVWYPTPLQDSTHNEVRTLWKDLYTGSFDSVKLFTSHLQGIETHSLVQAPIVKGQRFPVLIFNHGMMSTPEQNTILFEHLASNGYAIFSIAHTYQSTKVFLKSSEKVLFTTQLPVDLEISDSESRPTTGVREFTRTSSNGIAHSQLDEQLFTLFDSFKLLESDADKKSFVKRVLDDRESYLIGNQATPETLLNYFDGRMSAMGSIAQTWVEDIAFIVDEIENIDGPVQSFIDSIDLENLGVFGHSFGSVAAGEFCKLDDRCDAGIHIDGNQQGYNWKKPLLAPFMVMYSSNFYLGNEFAYKNSDYDFWNMTIDGIDHLDFTDLGMAVRGISGPGFMGTVDNLRALDIINDVTLSFFDYYLKNKPLRTDLRTVYPELTLELRE